MNNLLVLLGHDPKRLKELQSIHDRSTRTQERVVGRAVANKRDQGFAKTGQDQERTPELQRIRKSSAKVGIGKSSTRTKAGFDKAAKSKAKGNHRNSASAVR
jgi:hypothetical protein